MFERTLDALGPNKNTKIGFFHVVVRHAATAIGAGKVVLHKLLVDRVRQGLEIGRRKKVPCARFIAHGRGFDLTRGERGDRHFVGFEAFLQELTM